MMLNIECSPRERSHMRDPDVASLIRATDVSLNTGYETS
jgi:hypothetical protein